LLYCTNLVRLISLAISKAKSLPTKVIKEEQG